jgi:trigger factor
MQVSVEATNGLERRMTVTVPAERVDKEVENRLKSLSRTVRLAGFRPGKVPVKVVATRYGTQVRNEVIGELTQSSFQEAVSQENLRLAGMPQIEPKSTDAGVDLEYIATFEVFGDIELAPLSDTEIEKPVASISDDDVTAMVDKLRRQRAGWLAVERPAQEGDRLTIDFEGTIEGEAFDGNKAEQAPIVIGSNSFIPGFEDALIGAKPGDEVTIDLTFPENYRATAVAGKPVQFAVKIHEVAEAELPEVDAEFMSSFEVTDGNMDHFLKEIRTSMQGELDQALRDITKAKVLDELFAANPIDVPAAMVESSINDMMAQFQNNMRAQGGQVPDLDRSLFEPAARRKATLGMLLSDIARKQGFTADAGRIKEQVNRLAESYDDPDEVVRWYYADRSRLGTVESVVIEDMVIDWILENAKVTEKTMNFDEVMQSRQA